MRTDDLIKLLTEDAPVRSKLGKVLGLAVLAGVAVSVLLLLLTLGLRHDLGVQIETARVAFKIVETLCLALASLRLVFLVGRPGASLKGAALSLLLPAGLLVAASAIELSVLPRQDWLPSLVGTFPQFCMVFVPLFSTAPLVALMVALKQSAPENPTVAGAIAGLAAGGIGAAVYAWHCPDDSPLFLATWYVLAIALVSIVGSALGSRLLRW